MNQRIKKLSVPKRTIWPHISFYNIMKSHLDRMNAKEDVRYAALQAICCAAFMVEAYLNTVGQQLFADWSKKPVKLNLLQRIYSKLINVLANDNKISRKKVEKERESVAEKIRLIRDELSRHAESRGLQLNTQINVELLKYMGSVSETKKTRDSIVHNRQETIVGTWETSTDSSMNGLNTKWEEVVMDKKRVRELCENCAEFIKVLNRMCCEAGTEIGVSDPFLSDEMFVGIKVNTARS